MRKVNEKLLSEWRERLASAERDGLSIGEYARRHGIGVKAAYYWRRRILEADGKVTPRKPRKRHARATNFVKVAASSSSNAFELKTSSGYVVGLSNDFDSKALATLLDVLELRR